MMKRQLYTEQYDDKLKASIDHFTKYPQLIPFIGNEWNNQSNRILFIAESHYLPTESDNKIAIELWYNSDSSSLSQQELNWTSTREIFNQAGTSIKLPKGWTIYSRLKKAIIDALDIPANQIVFHNFSFYNYFQRPAEQSKGSIQNTSWDDEIAYYTLKSLINIIKPTTIFFLSKKAYNSFNAKKDDFFKETIIYSISHPASVWWHKKSKRYVDGGREEFKRIIKSLDLQLLSPMDY